MHYKKSRKRHTSGQGSLEKDQVLRVLSLEYQALADEISTRTSGRFQFLGFMTTAAALLVAGVGNLFSGSKVWISVGLAVVVFGVGLICFFWLGRHIVVLSARLAELEQRINQQVYPGGDQEALSWYMGHQERPLYARIIYGHFFTRSI
jgi:hypothetical protein